MKAYEIQAMRTDSSSVNPTLERVIREIEMKEPHRMETYTEAAQMIKTAHQRADAGDLDYVALFRIDSNGDRELVSTYPDQEEANQ